jgi:hypothetical protein
MFQAGVSLVREWFREYDLRGNGMWEVCWHGKLNPNLR